MEIFFPPGVMLCLGKLELSEYYIVLEDLSWAIDEIVCEGFIHVHIYTSFLRFNIMVFLTIYVLKESNKRDGGLVQGLEVFADLLKLLSSVLPQLLPPAQSSRMPWTDQSSWPLSKGFLIPSILVYLMKTSLISLRQTSFIRSLLTSSFKNFCFSISSTVLIRIRIRSWQS